MGNKSRKYIEGAIFETNHCGKVEIIELHGKRVKIRFLDNNVEKIVLISNLSQGKASHKQQNHRGNDFIGVIGEGDHKSYIKVDGKWKMNPEYSLWHHMLERCYHNERAYHSSYSDCTVCDRWLNFQNFCEDLPMIDNYQLWRDYQDKKIDVQYCLDKDIKIKGNRVYSLDACMFVSRSENSKEMIRRRKEKLLTSDTII